MITAVSLIFGALMRRQYDADRPLYRILGYVGVSRARPPGRAGKTMPRQPIGLAGPLRSLAIPACNVPILASR